MKSILLFLLIVAQAAVSQNQQYKISYTEKYNGKPVNETHNPVVYADGKNVLITYNGFAASEAYPKQQLFIDPVKETITTQAFLNSSRIISSIDSISIKRQNISITDETDRILGYNVRKATTSINSNTINLWFTTELPVKAAANSLGITLGTVLRYTRNNDYVMEAQSVEKLKTKENVSLNTLHGKIVDALTYQDMLMNARFTTIPVFKNEIISFNEANISNDSIFKFANGTVALRKITFPRISKGAQVFLDVREQSNGDAYDRTGSVFAILPGDSRSTFLKGLTDGIAALPVYDNGTSKKYQGIVSTDTYDVPLELMRFFTPFGISHFNHIKLKNKEWRDWVDYRQDISEFGQLFSEKEVYIGIFIGNYDKGGHKVSTNITIHPNDTSLFPDKVIMPLFNTTNVMEMAGQEYPILFEDTKALKLSFRLDTDLELAYLRYIATGHGGWENGDEFVPKEHEIYIDGILVQKFIPWRTDCGSYRLDNPASGNFSNGLSSSDLSRANWCPGTVTYPFYIPLGNLKKGAHTIEIKIPQGMREGNSFSYWNVSGVLIGK